ncbi:MAG TPA: cation-transporting P-type ATPase, partial [Longimicrobium sp.]|nr:cation-transporting P-type ATPase [Longimicrobium sp.]
MNPSASGTAVPQGEQGQPPAGGRRKGVRVHRVYPPQPVAAFWAAAEGELIRELGSSDAGLSDREAARRLELVGPNRPGTRSEAGSWTILARQFRSPASMLLAAAAVLAGFLGDTGDAAVVGAIVVASALLGFWQERGAAGAVAELLRRLQTRARVVRGGRTVE